MLTARMPTVACLLLLCSTLTVACVPIRGNDLPIRLAVQGEDIVLQWCGDIVEDLNYLEVTYRPLVIEASSSADDQVLLRGEGSYVLETEELFSSSDPPGRVIYSIADPLPLDDDRAMIFFAAGYAENTLSLMASFETESLLSMDGWLHPDGDVTESPC